MKIYADSSFLVAVYWYGEAGSLDAARWMQRQIEALPFTPLHRHEVRTGLRLKVFRGESSSDQQKAAFREIESDLADTILVHTPIPWTDAFRHAEEIGEREVEHNGIRSLDLLHVGIALALNAESFLTFDNLQRKAAKAAGLKTPF